MLVLIAQILVGLLAFTVLVCASLFLRARKNIPGIVLLGIGVAMGWFVAFWALGVGLWATVTGIGITIGAAQLAYSYLKIKNVPPGAAV